jgi:tetratricopeptide (TPR) repeat protein
MDIEYEGPAKELIIETAKWLNDWADYGSERLQFLCKDALGMDPKCFPAYIYLGLYEMEHKNLDKMEEHFLKALELADDPYNEFTWDWVVITLDDGLKEHARLARYLRRYCEKRPDLFAVTYLVRTLVQLGQKSEALSFVDSHLENHPVDSFKDLEKIAGTIWKALGERNKALSVLDEYIRGHPEDKKARKLRKKIAKAKMRR